MSDQDPSEQAPNAPLKKETVRVTLKAADAPTAVPTSALPATPQPTAPMAPPPAPSAPKPPTATVSAPPPAPTIQLKTAAGGAPGAPSAPAPTIRLNTGGAPTSPSSPAPTIRLATAGGGSPSLPKATVQLAPPTRPLEGGAGDGSFTQMPTLSGIEVEEKPSAVINVLAILGFIAAILLVFIQLGMASAWLGGPDQEGVKPDSTEWSKLF